MSRVYLVPKHITETQLRRIFKDSFEKLETYFLLPSVDEDRYNLCVLNRNATEQQDIIMNLLYE
jgi:hypothetical protein